MFLFALYNPNLKDLVQYWCEWEKESFIKESTKAIEYITPYFTESSSQRLAKRNIKNSLQWDKIDKIKKNELVRWPMQLIIYTNYAWEWAFEPPHCPLRPINPNLSPSEQEAMLNKYDFYTPKRIYKGSSMRNAIKAWSISDQIWLDHAFDLMSVSLEEILSKPEFGKSILKWCEKNEYGTPVFYKGKFYAYNNTLKTVVSLNEIESFTYLCQIMEENEKPIVNDHHYNVYSHQEPNHKPLLIAKE